MRNIQKYETFENYYETVISHLSENLVEELLPTIHNEVVEMVYVLFYKDIPDNTAVIVLENFLSIFKKHFSKPPEVI